MKSVELGRKTGAAGDGEMVGCGRQSAPGREVNTDVDDIVRDDSKTDPPLYALGALVKGSVQPMTPFQDANAALTAGAPLLRVLEPTLLLFQLAFLTLGRTAGN